MAAQSIVTTPEDCKWLRDTHLPKDAPQFTRALIYGNEDSPERVELYNRDHVGAKVADYAADDSGTLVRADGPAASGMDLDVFVDHYERAALWSSTDNRTDNGGDALDSAKYSDRLTLKAREAMRRDCAEWLSSNAALCRELVAKAPEYSYGTHPDCGTVDPVAAACAHDLWLTRNGHGAGFWDRDLGELGERLTAAAKAAGTRDLYVERGWIYQY